MPIVTDFRDELSLLYCLLLNTAVFGSTWFFARRLSSSRSQSLLDAALLGYAVQYLAIGIPGLLHHLNFTCVAGSATVLCGLLAFAARRIQPIPPLPISRPDRIVVGAVGLFAIAFLFTFAHSQAYLPVISNDAMTYHFPAAVQWLQQGHISLFPTWFFNPANTYSPLAGSMFILWLILPFGDDIAARFVEVPALLCVGLAMFRLCREVGTRASVAALSAAAAMLCRPIFLPCMMGKDDLFVAFFIITALVALSKNRAGDRWGAVRFGIALGLLLSTKYTAVLSIPILLVAVDSPKWSANRWLIAIGTAALLAGPWYLRNMVLTRNPVFPLGSLFTSSHSHAFDSMTGALAVIVAGPYALPRSVGIITGFAWLIACCFARKNPMVRACMVGAALGIAIFLWRSPFPEVRFILPCFLLLFACAAIAIDRFCRNEKLAIIAGALLMFLSVITLFPLNQRAATLPFSSISFIMLLIGTCAIVWIGDRHRRGLAVGATCCTTIFIFTYVNWAGYCGGYRETRFIEGSGYSQEYPDLTRLWRFVDEHVPADATVAYSNLYFVYPLQGGQLRRRLIYAPTRAGVDSISDLGWLGRNLSGEQLVLASIRATIAAPEKSIWLNNLQKSRAKYLVVGKNEKINLPPERIFAEADSRKFSLLFEGPTGWVYQINDLTVTRVPTPPDLPAFRAGE